VVSRRGRLALAVLAICLFGLAGSAATENGGPMILVFYEEGCSDCELVEELMAELIVDLPESAVERIEITEPGALELMTALAAAYGVVAETVPVVFVGEEAIVGIGRPEEFALRASIGDCAVRGCPSPYDRIRPPEIPWGDVIRLVTLVALVGLLLVLQPL